MKRFRNVLLIAGLEYGPVPHRLVNRALTLARRNEAKLTLIDVVPALELVPDVLPREMLELVLRARRQSLLRLAQSAQEQGVETTAEGVLRRVDCSLLTVKPEGFVSPIQPSVNQLDESPAPLTRQRLGKQRGLFDKNERSFRVCDLDLRAPDL